MKPRAESERIYRDQLQGQSVKATLDALGRVFLTLQQMPEPHTIPRADWSDSPLIYDEERLLPVPSGDGSDLVALALAQVIVVKAIALKTPANQNDAIVGSRGEAAGETASQCASRPAPSRRRGLVRRAAGRATLTPATVTGS